MDIPKADDILKGDFWPEPVRVVLCRILGNYVRLEAVGQKTNNFYQNILSLDDLRKVTVSAPEMRTFSGRPEAFFLGIEAQRIRNAYQFDPLYAVNVSQVDPLPHQIEAVYYHILNRPRIRFLLADDPGAGKTIMAGLLIKELKYRGLVERVLIVVPGQLRDQWLREMKERFGERFTAIDRDVMNATWGQNIWEKESQVITSMDFAKQDDVLAVLTNVHWDIAIVDEAHKMAAYQYGQKTDKTKRYRLGEVLSKNSRFLLFLTATPHRGDPQNFLLFLDLLEPKLFATPQLLGEAVQKGENPLFLRRLKEDLTDFNGAPLFPPRQVRTVSFRLNDDEKRLYNGVTSYVETTYNRALQAEKRNAAFAMLILQRRMASSVYAVRRSLERRKKRLEELLQVGRWQEEREEIDEEALEDAPEPERLCQEDQILERLTAAETREELEHEIEELDRLIGLAREAERHEVETKLVKLREVIQDRNIRESGEKLLVFTEAKDTLDYLTEKLRLWGFSVANIHGGMSLDERIRAERAFQGDGPQIMVSTEAGGEGINLHYRCSLMVNYDIPWNPNRLEQRMGRIHRYGQQKEVFIFNLVASDTREGAVLNALFRKLENIRAAYGQDEHGRDRVFDVIGDVLANISLKDLIIDAIANRRSLQEIIAQVESTPNEEAIRRVREASLMGLATRHIDLQRILGDQRAARENRLVPEYIERYAVRACRFLNLPLERRQDGLWRLERGVPSLRHRLPPDFAQRYGHLSEYPRFAFDKDRARREGAEFVAPGHPLLEAINDAILAETLADVQRGATFWDPECQLEGTLWFLEGEVRDGANRIAGKRLFAVYQPSKVGGAMPMRPVSPAVLWDLNPAPGASAPSTPEEEEPVVNWALGALLEPYKQELLERRQRDAEIKRRYGLRSLDGLILESEAKLSKYYERRAQGYEIAEVAVLNEQREREALEERKRRLEEELRLETTLSCALPKILGAARVTAPPQGSLAYDPETEAIAMRVAMAYERQQGRLPEDVSANKMGYDIRSAFPAPQAEKGIRYIEVKGHHHTGPVFLTPNEWLMAQRLGKDYWLYVVEDCHSAPRLYAIQDPASALQAQEQLDVVRYVVREWKQAAQAPAYTELP